MYSQHEALARERMQHRHREAAHRRLANQLAAGRRWRWLASVAANRAARSQRRSSAESTAHYELAG
jgi:hypothetical protein